MFSLPDLPYAYGALAPSMSERTLHFHHDKHHRAYVKKLNELLDKAGKSPTSLEEVVMESAVQGKEGQTLFNNAAQAWNHAFFWNCMSPKKAEPSGELAEAIRAAFGDKAKLGEKFIDTGAAHFGSGWVWLICDEAGKLEVAATHDAHDMVTEKGKLPLLVCDVWEHAYYLDYQNDRKKFLTTWFDALPNWAFAAEQFAAARRGARAWRYPAPMAHAEAV
ncbi:MAG: superoxide dismutase [Caulobacteraceae bacterium]